MFSGCYEGKKQSTYRDRQYPDFPINRDKERDREIERDQQRKRQRLKSLTDTEHHIYAKNQPIYF